MKKHLEVGDKLHCTNGKIYSVGRAIDSRYPLAIYDEHENCIDHLFRGHLYIEIGFSKLYVGDPIINTTVIKIT